MEKKNLEEIELVLLKRSVENSRKFGYLEKGAVTKRLEELEKVFEEEFSKISDSEIED